MDLLHKHLQNEDIQYRETYSHSSFLKEYVTCVKPKNDTTAKWSCMEGAYEPFCDHDPSYEYKVMSVYTYPYGMKKSIFERNNKDHTLFLRPKYVVYSKRFWDERYKE